MKTPFTTEQFFSVFERYNSVTFPAQIILLLLGIFSLHVTIFSRAGKNQTVGGLLGLFWIWMGLVYHITFFSSINPPAYIFGALFILQGIFFFWETYKRKKIEFSYSGGIVDYIAVFFVVFGLFIYPIISYLLTGSFAKTISFGLPCPTTIATFGFLMLARESLSKYLVIIPSLWALVGTTAAVSFNVYQDYLLIVSAIVANIFIFSNRKSKTEKPNEVSPV